MVFIFSKTVVCNFLKWFLKIWNLKNLKNNSSTWTLSNYILSLSLSYSRLLISMRKSNFHLDFPSNFSEWANTCFWCFIKEESKKSSSNISTFFACAIKMFTFFHYEHSTRAFTLTQISSNFEHFMLTKGCWKISLWAYKITRAHVSQLSLASVSISEGLKRKKTSTFDFGLSLIS